MRLHRDRSVAGTHRGQQGNPFTAGAAVTRTDNRGSHYADCIFCGKEWIVSAMVKEPYTCPVCRALYRQKPRKKARKKK